MNNDTNPHARRSIDADEPMVGGSPDANGCSARLR